MEKLNKNAQKLLQELKKFSNGNIRRVVPEDSKKPISFSYIDKNSEWVLIGVRKLRPDKRLKALYELIDAGLVSGHATTFYLRG